MKRKIFYIAALGLMTGFSIPAMSQTDTLTKPGKTNNAFQDPKITKDNSKVLVDTSNHMIDSLLDPKKSARKKNSENNINPLGESDKPVKINKTKKAPTDSGRMVKP